MACGLDLSSLKKVIAWQPFLLMRAVSLANFNPSTKNLRVHSFSVDEDGKGGGGEHNEKDQIAAKT